MKIAYNGNVTNIGDGEVTNSILNTISNISDRITNIEEKFENNSVVVLNGEAEFIINNFTNGGLGSVGVSVSRDAMATFSRVYDIPETINIQTVGQAGELSNGKRPIYIWGSGAANAYVYYYTEAETIYVQPTGYGEGMFKSASNIKYIDTTGWNISKLYDTSGLNNAFSGCSSLTDLDISTFNISGIRDYNCMFSGCNRLVNLTLPDFSVLPANIYATEMFFNCRSLTSSINLSNTIIRNAKFMFYECLNVTNIDISGSTIYNISMMFNNCRNLRYLNIDNTKFISKSSNRDLTSIFSGCNNIQSLNLLSSDFTNSTNSIICLFDNCGNLTEVYLPNLYLSTGTYARDWFNNCTNLRTIYYNPSNFYMPSSSLNRSNVFLNCVNLVGPGGAYDRTKVHLTLETVNRYFTPIS